ncbi:hypothetical protein [Azospirillum thermophilum]|uniref:hypothetical protein n=1 Tax=Azospirillum thermophilum TaxID=2202148 RepID=UPI001FECE8D5|nr:hypothetical protein [Azospirillum thermophilum]
MQPVEITREESTSGPVFIATPAKAPPIRTRALLIAGAISIMLIGLAGLAPEPHAGLLRWLAALCTLPVLLMWVVALVRTVRSHGVRLAVTPVGLTVNGRMIYPHKTIRDLVLMPMTSRKPLFIAHVSPDADYGHRAELDLVTGAVPVEGPEELKRAAARPVRLVMRRKGKQPAIVLVRGLSLSAGETLLAALAAELRPHAR